MVAKAPEIYRRRIAYVRVGLEFTRKMLEVRELATRYKTDKEAADRVRALWKELDPIAKEKENYIYRHAFLNIRNSLHPEPMKAGTW